MVNILSAEIFPIICKLEGTSLHHQLFGRRLLPVFWKYLQGNYIQKMRFCWIYSVFTI